jgi:short-subunit dehydrogenase
MATALVIGSSSGIGRALCERLLDDGWAVIGVARRAGLTRPGYVHVIADVLDAGYRDALAAAIGEQVIDACVYAAGIGHPLDVATLAGEAAVFATNLGGLALTAEVVVPAMVARGAGHLVGLSSQADRLISAEAPSYAASKAGMSAYLEGLAGALRPRGVAVSNVRFGFVDTAMAKAEVRPFLMSAPRAAAVIARVIARRPVRRTAPWRMAIVIWLIASGQRVRGWLR